MQSRAPLTLGLVLDSPEAFEVLSERLPRHTCLPVESDHLDELEEWGGVLGGVPLGVLDALLLVGEPGPYRVSALAALSRPSRRAGTPLIAVGAQTPEEEVSLLLTGADAVISEASSDLVMASIRAYKRLRSTARLVEAATEVSPPASREYRWGPFVADFRTYRVTVDGRPVELAPRQFDLLVYLMQRPGEVVSKDDILNNVWGLDFDPNTNIVNVYVHYLRSKLAPLGYTDVIRTVRGRGFSFEAHRGV